jgi:hypothetical protein
MKKKNKRNEEQQQNLKIRERNEGRNKGRGMT